MKTQKKTKDSAAISFNKSAVFEDYDLPMVGYEETEAVEKAASDPNKEGKTSREFNDTKMYWTVHYKA